MARRKTTTDATEQTETTALAPVRAALDVDQVTTVFRWILEGNSEHDVREAIAAKWPHAPADPLIIAAVTRFQDAGRFQPEIMTGWCAEAYREIYRRSLEAGDCAAALRAVKLLSELAGGR